MEIALTAGLGAIFGVVAEQKFQLWEKTTGLFSGFEKNAAVSSSIIPLREVFGTKPVGVATPGTLAGADVRGLVGDAIYRRTGALIPRQRVIDPYYKNAAANEHSEEGKTLQEKAQELFDSRFHRFRGDDTGDIRVESVYQPR